MEMDENNEQFKEASLPESKNRASKIQNIHTYQSDMADLVREQEASVIKIALAEQKRNIEKELTSEGKITNPKNLLWVLGGIVFVGLAIGGVIFLMKKTEVDSTTMPTPREKQTFISFDTQSTVDASRVITKDDFAKIIKTELATPTKTGLIKVIFPEVDGKLLTTNQFLNLLNITLPGILARSLSDQFMIGAYLVKNNDPAIEAEQHLFLIFQTTDYSQAFAGILEWEKLMFSDLFPVFGFDISGEKSALLQTPFRDLIIQNKDARVLTDSAGNNILYYLFVNNNTFVITDNRGTIAEILARLVIKNIKPL